MACFQSLTPINGKHLWAVLPLYHRRVQKIQVIDFENSYAPVASIAHIHIYICIEAAKKWKLYVLDVSNAYQNIIIKDPTYLPFMSLPYKFISWYKRCWTLDPTYKVHQSQLAIQCIRIMQGTKPAGHDWYTLLNGFLLNLGINRSASDHGVYTWHYTDDNTLQPTNTCYYRGIICLYPPLSQTPDYIRPPKSTI